MKPSKIGREKKWNWRPRRSRVPSVSFFFPDRFWRFHNFMPLKIMKPSASFIFDAKIIRKQNRQFHKVFTWNCGTIKNKNKDGFCWNLFFSIKQGNKSRLNTVISFAILTSIPQYLRSTLALATRPLLRGADIVLYELEIGIKYLGLINFRVSGIHFSQNDLISWSKYLIGTKYKIINTWIMLCSQMPLRNTIHYFW